MNTGILYALGAYSLWGAFPIYFKAIGEIPPLEIMLTRVVWSTAFIALVLTLRGRWKWLALVLRQPRVVAGFAASALCLSSNWLVYIWAVNSGQIVESSLGYFINPLFNVLLGSLLLHERLRPGQWTAVTIAALGVGWLTWQAGNVPWIALMLASTFALYGLLRKTAPLGALEGLALETLLLFPLAATGLALLWSHENLTLTGASAAVNWMLVASGPLTAIPLLLFAAGARRIPLSLLGLLQYIGPTLQLLIGILLYNEPFSGMRLAGFAFIWAALAVYSIEGVWQAWNRTPGKEGSQ